MNLIQLIQRVRQHTRDLSNSIFRERDIIDFINESIERFQQYIPELKDMVSLEEHSDVPILLPKQYHSLLSVYATSRCFGQDERHYQATTFMNEFETKLVELGVSIDAGDVVILDEDGNRVTREENYDTEYVTNKYFD